jgi:hypothetical protein
MTPGQVALIERAEVHGSELDNSAEVASSDGLPEEAKWYGAMAEAFKDLAAELKRMAEENARLRTIISRTAHELGAHVSTECSVEFMAHLPEEARLVLSKLRDRLAKCEPLVAHIRGIQNDMEHDHKDRAWDSLAELRMWKLPPEVTP